MTTRAQDSSSRLAATAALGLVGLASILAGCGSETVAKRTDTIDVTPAIEVSPDDDPQAKPEVPRLTGALPGDFPSDLPIYLPSSVVDFSAGDPRSVTLLSPHHPSHVRRELDARWRKEGWQPVETGGRLVLKKGQRGARVSLEDARPGTVYTIEY